MLCVVAGVFRHLLEALPAYIHMDNSFAIKNGIHIE